MFSFDYQHKSVTNIDEVDPILSERCRFRRSFDLGTHKTGAVTRQSSISISPVHSTVLSTSGNSTPIPKNPSIFIRRRNSEKCLQKRHSVDSNNSNSSDPGYSSINIRTFLSPAQLRTPKEPTSPKSCHSSNMSVTGRNSSYSSMAFLSRQSSTNSSKLLAQRESEENLQSNRCFSSSSVILTRVKSMKEKFRRVVVQSVQPDDWPPPSVLFSDRYCHPSNSSSQSSKMYPKKNLVKSKSIDHSSFDSCSSTNVKSSRNFSPAGSGRNFKHERLQRSLTSYAESIGGDNGIVCSDLDLKAIISTFKREELSKDSNRFNNTGTSEDKSNLTQNVSKTPIGTSSVMGSGFGKRKMMRKQVSFDDEQGMMMMNRKVSAIAEEIEGHSAQESRIGTSVGENLLTNNQNLSSPIEITNEDEEENCVPYGLSLLPKEIEFDEYGQTWEIYGADPDPEILGQVIEHHLERLMVCSLPNGNAARPSNDVVQSKSNTQEDEDISIRLFKPLRVDLQSPENNLRFFARRLCGKWSCFASGHQDSGNKVIASVDQSH